MFKQVYNKPKWKNRRRSLRKNQTETETILWIYLCNRKLNDTKFFRQYSIGNYIIDFYCPKKKLAIEIDGGQHTLDKVEEHDKKRTEYLKTKEIRVIRFWNNEVFENIDGVIDRIVEELK